MPTIDRPEPPYMQVVRHIRDQITSGQLREGEAIPSARQLAASFDIALATATKVHATLRAEGLVRGVPGIGTVVHIRESPIGILRNVAAEVTAAAHTQRQAEPHHADFHALALAVENVLDGLYALNANLGGQVAHYHQGRRLRTDTDRTPQQVLATALEHGTAMHTALQQARQAARGMAEQFARLGLQPDEK